MYLFEAAAKKLKHLDHLEDMHFLPHVDSHEGFNHAEASLNHVYAHVHNTHQNKSTNASNLSVKLDGSPSIVAGRHPETGKYFVATKSAFNKTPKLNYSHSDIDANHGHAPGLVSKLKQAFTHLHKTLPSKGVFQGDLMHTPDDHHHHENGMVSFKPNTIKYTTTTHADAKAVKKSKVGVAFHTQYHGKTLDSMEASPIKDHSVFKSHDDVHHISPSYSGGAKEQDPKFAKKFSDHLTSARLSHDKTNYSHIEAHKAHLPQYINQTIRDKSTPSVAGYKQHLETKQGGKFMPMSNLSKDETTHIGHALKTHKNLQAAKDMLTAKAADNYTKYDHSLASGKKTGPEGFVASHTGHSLKYVNRKEFSAANFEQNK